MSHADERARVLTLVFTDLADSTALKTQRGDHAVGELIARHRDRVHSLADANDGRVIDWAGDGCFLTFETSSAAVLFALRLQQAHHEQPELPGVRIGIHMGEVTEKTLPEDDRAHVEGLAVDLASRIESLAVPGQVLMSSAVFNSVRQRLRGEELGVPIAWRAHGAYELKGFDDAVAICEAGIEGVSPLVPPQGSEKAHRAVTPTEEETLGWRPAVGLAVPRRDHWVLEQQLGEGGFGEVWLAIHEKTKAKRVFKFCFEPERVRGLKREVVLFRLLKESLGHRDDIAQIVDWEFERPPYFLESEYTEGGDLKDWAAVKGGLDRVPLDTRLELVAQIAVALGAAHSVGVLHKDIKPTNILIQEVAGNGAPRASLTDFGIGLITDPGALAAQGITATGLTETLVGGSSSSSSGAGTRLYMAPELLEGKGATTLSDIYSLGVVLYQMVTGDLSHAVASGWERDIKDDLLREDVALCLDGDPNRRLKSADELAERLRSLDRRRKEIEQRERTHREAERAKRRRRQFLAISAVGATLTLIVGLVAIREYRRAETQAQLRAESEQARELAEQEKQRAEAARNEAETLRAEAEQGQYFANIRLAASLLDQEQIASARALLADAPPQFRNWEWGYLVNRAWPPENKEEIGLPAPAPGMTTADLWSGASSRLVSTLVGHTAPVAKVQFHPDGRRVLTLAFDHTLRIWDIASGKQLVAREQPGPASAAGGFAIHPDGLTYAISYGNNRVALCDTASGDVIREFSGMNEGVGFLKFSRSGDCLWAASADRAFYIWDVGTGETMAAMKRPVESGETPDAAFVPGTTKVYVTWPGNRVRLWDYAANEVLQEVKGPGVEEFFTGQFNADGSQVMSWAPSISAITVWNTRTGAEVRSGSFGPSQLLCPAVWARDGSAILHRSNTNVLLLDTTDPARFAIVSAASQRSGVVDPGALNADGSLIAVPEADGSVRILAPTHRASLPEDTLGTEGGDVVYTADTPADGVFIVTGGFDGWVRIWDPRSLAPLREFKAHDGEITVADLSPDARYLFTYGFDGSNRLWDVNTGELLFEKASGMPSQSFAGGARGVAVRLSPGLVSGQHFSPDGSRLALSTGVGEVTVVDVPSGDTVYVAKADQNWSYNNQFSPDGRYLGTMPYQESFITLFNAQTGEKIAKLGGHEAQVISYAFSPDSALVATASSDGTVRLWNTATGDLVRILENRGVGMIQVTFSPDGTYVAGGGAGNDVIVWEVATGEKYATLAGHNGIVYDIGFSPDGQRILTASLDNTARIWNLDGQLTAVLAPAANESLYYAGWSPDGQSVITTTGNGTAKLWRAVDWSVLSAAPDSEQDFEAQLQKLRSAL